MIKMILIALLMLLTACSVTIENSTITDKEENNRFPGKCVFTLKGETSAGWVNVRFVAPCSVYNVGDRTMNNYVITD